MDEALWGPAPENRGGPVKVKVEDSEWEQVRGTQEHGSHAQELCRMRFRRFSYQEVTGPREALSRLHELCRLWLRPETHSKEQMLELLVLEQFLRILPAGLRARVWERRPQSGEEAVTALQDTGTDAEDRAQQASVYTQGQDMHFLVTDCQGASVECQSLHLLPGATTMKGEPPEFPDGENVQAVSLSTRGEFRSPAGPAPQKPAALQVKAPRDKAPAPEFKSARPQTSVKTEDKAARALVPEEQPHLRLAQRNLCGDSAQEVTDLSLRTEEVVTKDELLNAKQEASEGMDQGAEASKIPKRDRVPRVTCGAPVTDARPAACLNTLKQCRPGDLWARTHISSLEYAAGDVTRKGRKKYKARVSELLQGLTFSGDSDVEENNEPEAQPAPKKLKSSSVPERTWAQRDIKPSFPNWSVLDSSLLNLKSEKLSPVELFELFFDDETFNLIVSETNKYASQKDVSLEVTVQEMRCVFGVLLWSGIVRRPRRAMYWEISDAGQSWVRESIARDRFELIFSHLHFSDNSCLDPKDKYTKLRPLIKQMNKNFLLYAPLQEYYCFDKTMCECLDSGRSLNGRPVRVGYKMWCGTTTQGYLVWFEPHQEESSVPADKDLDLGLGGNLAMCFADALLERGQHPYHLCFNGSFTSVQLVSALRKKGVRATGTICENKMEKCPLMNTAHMKTMQKGYFDFQVEENEEIILCRWHGNGVSSLCSSAFGIEPVSEVCCFADDRISRISCPSIVKLYDECREGVANMDQIISKYKVRIRSKKWYSVLVSFMVDVAMNNAWQLHRACNPGASLNLSDFWTRVAHAYLEPSASLSDQGR